MWNVWIYHTSLPGRAPRKCEECGACDCGDGHHGERLLCQLVGECSGLWYSVWQHIETREILCDGCYGERVRYPLDKYGISIHNA